MLPKVRMPNDLEYFDQETRDDLRGWAGESGPGVLSYVGEREIFSLDDGDLRQQVLPIVVDSIESKVACGEFYKILLQYISEEELRVLISVVMFGTKITAESLRLSKDDVRQTFKKVRRLLRTAKIKDQLRDCKV